MFNFCWNFLTVPSNSQKLLNFNLDHINLSSNTKKLFYVLNIIECPSNLVSFRNFLSESAYWSGSGSEFYFEIQYQNYTSYIEDIYQIWCCSTIFFKIRILISIRISLKNLILHSYVLYAKDIHWILYELANVLTRSEFRSGSQFYFEIQYRN